MIDLGKRNVLGVLVDAVDQEAAVHRIIHAASTQSRLSVSALAVHGVMEGVSDPSHRARLNALDLVTPDGQAVRWGLNGLHNLELPDRVYGPDLMRALCVEASNRKLPIYIYGSTAATLTSLSERLREAYPNLIIAGAEPSKFKQLTQPEVEQVSDRINRSGARLTFIGLGCPRQEVFAYEYRDLLNSPVIAVGAAFDFLAGNAAEPRLWVQRAGLQWAHRLLAEPRRLWRRYLVLNPKYLALLAAQRSGLWRPETRVSGSPPPALRYG